MLVELDCIAYAPVKTGKTKTRGAKKKAAGRRR
jgi:hypothetical protein